MNGPLWLLRLLARRRLPALIGAADATRVDRWLGASGPAALANMQRAVAGQVADWRGRPVRQAFLLSAVLHRALAETLESVAADNALRRFLHPLMRPIFALSMRPLPAGPDAFAVFKQRYIKANRPLTLMTWAVTEDAPDAFQADFSRCGLAEAASLIGRPELCRFYCEYDEIFFGAYDPRLTFVREETIASGFSRCTFRFLWKH